MRKALELAELCEGWPGEFHNEVSAELRRLGAEMQEQCRLLGLSAERELALLAELEQARAQMERQKDEWLSWEAKRRGLEKAAAELEMYKAARVAYASEFPPNADGEPDVGSIHQNIRALKSELESLKRAISEAEPVAWRDPTNEDHKQSVTFLNLTAMKWPHIYKQPLYTLKGIK